MIMDCLSMAMIYTFFLLYQKSPSSLSKSKTQHGKYWKETTKFWGSVSLINDVAFYNWQVDSSTLTMSSAGFRNPASYRDYG